MKMEQNKKTLAKNYIWIERAREKERESDIEKGRNDAFFPTLFNSFGMGMKNFIIVFVRARAPYQHPFNFLFDYLNKIICAREFHTARTCAFSIPTYCFIFIL